MNILVTGAAGFIGAALAESLATRFGYNVSGSIRHIPVSKAKAYSLISVGGVSKSTDWSFALRHIHVVIHLAARAHVLGDDVDALAEFRSVNVEGALALARQALAAGVKRFIFISSIGVNGAQTFNEPFNESCAPAPHADYALSKLEAEQSLSALVKDTAMELVIIRPPLVYAGHAPGNFQRLLKIVASGAPLPFATVSNQRSMIALENLVDFIALCVEHPAAANQLFLTSDGNDVSTTEIVRYLAAGMNQKARLFSVPNALMSCGASLLGKQAIYSQLYGSLAIDSSKARALIGWKPKKTPAKALFEAGRDFKRR